MAEYWGFLLQVPSQHKINLFFRCVGLSDSDDILEVRSLDWISRVLVLGSDERMVLESGAEVQEVDKCLEVC
jgi:hypothetical protein